MSGPYRYCIHCRNNQVPSGFSDPGPTAKCRPCSLGRTECLKSVRVAIKRSDDLIARYQRRFEQGVDVKTLFMSGDLAKNTVLRLLRNAEKRGVLFSRPKYSGDASGRMYFLYERMAKAYKPVQKLKIEVPIYTRKNLASFKTSDRPINISKIKPFICPANRDTRYTPVEPFQKVFSAMRIGQYL